MSKKKQRQLLLLLGCLAAAVLILVAVLLYNRHLAAQEAAAESDSISIGLSTEPTEVRWTSATGTVALVQDGEGNWTWAEDADFPLNTTTVQAIVTALSNPAQREIEIADSLEAYGLAEPSITLETVDSEGSQLQLLIGNSFTEGSEEYYYAMRSGGDTILILDTTLVGQLTETINDLADTSPLDSIDESQVTSLTIQGAQESSFTVQSETVEDEEGNKETEYHWYNNGTDVTSSTLLSSITEEALDPTFISLAYWKPDEATLAACGLDTPITATVIYTDDDGNAAHQTLSIGGLDENGSYYYCSADGGQSVYLIGAASLTDIITVANSGFDAAQEAADTADTEE